jgi:rubrerythrin
MSKWRSFDEVLDFAIGGEEASVEFYTRLAEQMKSPRMRTVFRDFAQEEMRHKEILLKVKAGGAFEPAQEEVLDLKIADYSVDVEVGQDMDYQAALVVAMKKEKAAFRLYTDLAARTGDEKLRATLLALAQEEAKHKLRFEVEYDDLLTGN